MSQAILSAFAKPKRTRKRKNGTVSDEEGDENDCDDDDASAFMAGGCSSSHLQLRTRLDSTYTARTCGTRGNVPLHTHGVRLRAKHDPHPLMLCAQQPRCF